MKIYWVGLPAEFAMLDRCSLHVRQTKRTRHRLVSDQRGLHRLPAEGLLPQQPEGAGLSRCLLLTGGGLPVQRALPACRLLLPGAGAGPEQHGLGPLLGNPVLDSQARASQAAVCSALCQAQG